MKAYKLMIQEKDAGRAILKYPKTPEKTFFDASRQGKGRQVPVGTDPIHRQHRC